MDIHEPQGVLLWDAEPERGWWRLVCHGCGWKGPKHEGSPGTGGASVQPKCCDNQRITIHDLGRPCTYCYEPRSRIDPRHCTCDDFCDDPCPVHAEENLLQDERLARGMEQAVDSVEALDRHLEPDPTDFFLTPLTDLFGDLVPEELRTVTFTQEHIDLWKKLKEGKLEELELVQPQYNVEIGEGEIVVLPPGDPVEID